MNHRRPMTSRMVHLLKWLSDRPVNMTVAKSYHSSRIIDTALKKGYIETVPRSAGRTFVQITGKGEMALEWETSRS